MKNTKPRKLVLVIAIYSLSTLGTRASTPRSVESYAPLAHIFNNYVASVKNYKME